MELQKRKLQRLKGYDYSTPNYYYVTICTYQKKCIFGKTEYIRKIVETELLNISKRFDRVKIDKYVIMPNHIHMIIVLGCDGVPERSRPFPTLSNIVGLFKSGVSKQIHERYPNLEIWQKSFYDTIIRNDEAYNEIVRYIEENPIKWENDEYFRGEVNGAVGI